MLRLSFLPSASLSPALLTRWPPESSNDESALPVRNFYTIAGDVISIYLWLQPPAGEDPKLHVLSPSVPITSLQITTVHRSSYVRYRMWETTFYCVYDHLSERDFPAYIDELQDHPHLYHNWQLQLQRHENRHFGGSIKPFPFLSNLVYRPLHTLFYLSEAMRAASPHVYEHAHRVLLRHLDDNPFNNVAPHLHELLVRRVKDRSLLLKDGNLSCLFAPESTRWKTILQHYFIRLPHIYSEMKKVNNNTVVDRWALITAESKRHTMVVRDNNGIDCKALLQHYATLIPTYITRQSLDLSQPDRCTGRQTDPISTELVMAPPATHRLFIDEAPVWSTYVPRGKGKKANSEGARRMAALPYSATMQFFARPRPEWLRRLRAKEERSRKTRFFCYTYGASDSEDAMNEDEGDSSEQEAEAASPSHSSTGSTR